MDVVYIYKHSPHDDFEIRYSLRSLSQFAPHIRKVWIYGDRPRFISHDRALIEHVPHSATSPVLGVAVPVQNFFLQMVLSSVIPDLLFEYLLFSDDFFLLKPLKMSDARKIRYLEDLSQIDRREPGPWPDAIWRTYDLLKAQGFTGFNFETHTPAYLNRKWVLDAFLALKDFVAQDRWDGMLGPTAVLNHAHAKENFQLVILKEENSRCGFWGKPPSYEEVVPACEGKLFFNFDDFAFGDGIKRFLTEKFPTPSRYEIESWSSPEKIRSRSQANG
jgi:hypothetical protein